METQELDQELDNFFSLDSEDGDSQEDNQDLETTEEVEASEEETQEEDQADEEQDDTFTAEKENKMLKKQKQSLKTKLSKYEQEIEQLKELNAKYESGEMTHEELVKREISKYKIETMQDQEIGKSSEQYWIDPDAIKAYVDKWLSVEQATKLAVIESGDPSKLLDDQAKAKIKGWNGLVGWPTVAKAKPQTLDDLAKDIDSEWGKLI